MATTDDVTHLRALLAEQAAEVERLRDALADEHAGRCADQLDLAGAIVALAEQTARAEHEHDEMQKQANLAVDWMIDAQRAVLDEADEMLSRGFWDEVTSILDTLSTPREHRDNCALARPDLGAGMVVVPREVVERWRDVLTELTPTCRCDEAWTSRGRHEVNALCHMADDAKVAIADLDALLRGKVGT